jgi:hypothetical protein
MNLKQIWSILQGRQTNFTWMRASYTYYPDGDPMGKPNKPIESDAEKEWKRLNAVFHEALDRYPHSKFALHWLWNNAIATGPESYKPPPAPPVS